MRTIRLIRFTGSSLDLRSVERAGARNFPLLSGVLAAGFLLLSGTGTAWAASILNEDSKAHVVMVTDGRFRNEMHLAPGEAATEVCARCRFDVQNIGRMDAQDNDVVIITTEGRLEKRT